MIEAWFSASEKIAILSSSAGFLPTAKRELILPRAVITAILAENPVGHRRQSYRTTIQLGSKAEAMMAHVQNLQIKNKIGYLFLLEFCQ